MYNCDVLRNFGYQFFIVCIFYCILPINCMHFLPTDESVSPSPSLRYASFAENVRKIDTITL